MAAYAASLAAPISSPSPVTASTRPPLVRPSVSPAGKSSAPPSWAVGGERDRVAERRARRVPGGRGDDGACGAELRGEEHRVERTLRRGEGQRGEVAVEERQHDLRLGIAEAHVVLDETRAVGGEHQPGVEEPDVRRAGGGKVVEHRLHERRDEVGRRRTGPARARTRPCHRCSARCRPRRRACGPGRAGRPRRGCRRTSRSASTPGPPSAPRARTGRPSTPIAAYVSDSDSGTVTPLPAASPSSLTTTGWPSCVEPLPWRRRCSPSLEAGEPRARGCRGSSASSRA